MILKDLNKSKSEILINVAYTLELVPESKDYSSRDFEIEYLKANVCETRQEKEIIERVLKRAPSWATIKRYRAWLQNEMWKYEKSDKKKKLDKELEKKVKEDLKNITVEEQIEYYQKIATIGTVDEEVAEQVKELIKEEKKKENIFTKIKNLFTKK